MGYAFRSVQSKNYVIAWLVDVSWKQINSLGTDAKNVTIHPLTESFEEKEEKVKHSFASSEVITLPLGGADLCRSSALLLGNPELKRNIPCLKHGREALAVFSH